jgi:tetratricopeptide (TPR) repeat protein
MSPDFKIPPSKIFGLALSLALGFLYLTFSCSQYVANYFADKKDLQGLQTAIRLDPWNADYRYQLGRVLSLSQQPREAASALRKAIELNPNASRYWMALASENFVADSVADARSDIQQATAADPTNPGIAEKAGNLYLAQGDTHAAFQQFRNAMDGEPSLAAQIIPVCWQAYPDADALLLEAIPSEPSAYSEFLGFLISKKETEAARRVWEEIVKLGQPAKLSDVFDYIRFLVGRHEPVEASTVWREAGPLCGLQRYQNADHNLVVNGNFNLDLLNGGFDWTYEKRQDVGLELDPIQPHSGPHPLLISYDSAGLNDSGISQLISVQPNTAYHFGASFKTRVLEGAGGPRFTLQDFYSGVSYLETEDLKDAVEWKQISGDLQTGPETQLLNLRIARVPGGAAIRGQLWIDGVRLEPVAKQKVP